jgi:hypothetical protein
MRRGHDTLRQCMGPVLAILLPTLAATVPLLDMMPEDGRSGIESEHHPGTHGPPHNHLICIQQAANQWVRAPGAWPSVAAQEVPLPPLPDRALPLPVSLRYLPLPRAPPLA